MDEYREYRLEKQEDIIKLCTDITNIIIKNNTLPNYPMIEFSILADKYFYKVVTEGDINTVFSVNRKGILVIEELRRARQYLFEVYINKIGSLVDNDYVVIPNTGFVIPLKELDYEMYEILTGGRYWREEDENA